MRRAYGQGADGIPRPGIVRASRTRPPAAPGSRAFRLPAVLARLRWLVVAACFAFGTAACAQQTSEVVSARREANVVQVKGQPIVLMWARGLTDAADLDAYVASGFNTAYVLISGASGDKLTAASALMTAAEEKNLLVVAAVTPSAIQDSDGHDMAPDPTSDVYVSAVSDLATKLAGQLGKHTGLIGWSIEAVPPNGFPWDDDSFRVYLRNWYQNSVSALNGSWGRSYDGWDQVTMGAARDGDADNPAGIGRASIDLASYKQVAYADALDLWAKALRAADPGRLIFASALPDYRSIISIRTTFDGMILNTYPNLAEQDFLTHNVHAVDIARRANQFAAIPTFWTDSSADPNRTANWMNEALLHGATGLALSSWSAVNNSGDLQAMVKATADWMRNAPNFPATPLARVAILYEPIAGGAQRNGKGLYGYLDGLTPDEPTTLFGVARMGTRYGQVDVLSRDSLGRADLRQYGTIFAPMALYLPEDAQISLHDFVLRGGALVVDAGVGMYQGDDGTVNAVPPVLMELLGMRYTEIAEKDQPNELGSPGQPGQPAQPGVAIPVGPGEAGLKIDPDVAKFADILGDFLSRPDVRKYLGEEFVGEKGPGFRVRGLATGFAVYTPTFLYASWNAGDPYFDDFHQRMLSWRYDLELIQPDALWPSIGAASYSNGSIGVVSPSGAAAIVDVYGGRNQAYQVPLGAIRFANPEEQNRVELLFPGEPLAAAQPIPIYIRTPDEGAVVTASIVRYDSAGIDLAIYGNGAQATVTADGVRVAGGAMTNVEIEIHDGSYRLARGSMHRVVVEGLRSRRTEETMMPDPDTGFIVLQLPIRAARITIEPAPAQ